jgi:hypothetical protein
MPDGGENDFGRKYEINSKRAHVAAYVLIAGLVLELVNAAIWFHGWETIAGITAVLLIVGGVWGEVFFGHKARIMANILRMLVVTSALLLCLPPELDSGLLQHRQTTRHRVK